MDMIASDGAAKVADPPRGPDTVDALMRYWAGEAPAAAALVDPPDRDRLDLGPSRRLTFAQADAVVERLGAAFRRVGLDTGDVVALQLPNTVEAPLILLALWRAGLIACPVPMQWRLAEIDRAFSQVAPRAVVTVAEHHGQACAETVCQAAVDHLSIRFVFGFGPNLPDGVTPIDEWLASVGADAPGDPLPATRAEATAVMTWSAAAAGPFPVPRTHGELMALGRVFVEELRLTARDTLLGAFPPTTVAALGGLLVPWLRSGSRLVLHQPFELDLFLGQLAEEAVTYTAVPAPLMGALDEKGRLKTHGRRLARIGCVWSEPSAGLRGDIAELPLPILDIHNLSEIGVLLRRRRVGHDPTLLPLGWSRMAGAQSDDGLYVETRLDADTGVVELRGPTVPHGDLAPAGVDAEALLRPDAEGFVACPLTGRTADGGDRFRCQRSPDLIHHGGVAVAAGELDRLYADHPDFLDAAAFAIEDPVMGERIVAAVVPRPHASLSLEALRRSLIERQVAFYKLPDRLIAVSSIPRDGEGRVARGDILRHVA